MSDWEQRQAILHDIAKSANNRKNGITNEIDNLISELVEEYQTLLQRKDAEITILQEKLEHYTKENRELYTVKNDLLESLDSHSLSSKKFHQTLAEKDMKIDELQTTVDHLKKQIDLFKDSQNQEQEALIAKINTLQKALYESENKGKEVNDLKDKITNLRSYIESGGIAYSRAMLEQKNQEEFESKLRKQEESEASDSES